MKKNYIIIGLLGVLLFLIANKRISTMGVRMCSTSTAAVATTTTSTAKKSRR